MTCNLEIQFKPLIFDITTDDNIKAMYNEIGEFTDEKYVDTITGAEYQKLNLPDKVRDPNGNLLLYVLPSDYTSVTINQGSNFIPTGGPSYLNIALVRKGFRLRVDYQETIIRHAVHMLARYAIGNRCLITIKDYVAPESTDIVTEYVPPPYDANPDVINSQYIRVSEESFTIRTGIIQAPIEYNGTIGSANPNGFSISFIEKDLRYI